jgi:hypothetical protein
VKFEEKKVKVKENKLNCNFKNIRYSEKWNPNRNLD